MGMIDYELDEHVAVLTMNHGENKFTFEFFDAFHQVLDEILEKTDTRVLVVKSSHEKIWCNGIDLDWLIPLIQQDPEMASQFPERLTGLYRRILMYPMITVAAINGHAFAGGCIMAAAFDFRFMRSDRGFFCLPEVNIGIPLAPSMVALMEKAVPMYKFLEMQYLGARLTADQCAEHHIVMKACHLDDLMGEVMAFAKQHPKERNMLQTMKEITNKEMLRIFDVDDPAFFASGKTGLG